MAVTFSGNFDVMALTSSHALRRRVSVSLPSMSRRTYSTKFMSKSSSSSSRTCMLGSATFSISWTRDSSVPNTLVWCTLFPTVVRNRIAARTTSSWLAPRVSVVSRFHTSRAKEYFTRGLPVRNSWNSSSCRSMKRFRSSHTAALTRETSVGASGSASVTSGLSYPR